MKMKYDTSTLDGKIAVMEQYKNKPDGLIISLGGGRWKDYDLRSSIPSWNWGAHDYNYPAESEPPKLVPWTFETCPKERMWIRPKFVVGQIMELVTRISFSLVFAADWKQPKTFEQLFSDYEHSLDNGHTWLPCGTEEKQ